MVYKCVDSGCGSTLHPVFSCEMTRHGAPVERHNLPAADGGEGV